MKKIFSILSVCALALACTQKEAPEKPDTPNTPDAPEIIEPQGNTITYRLRIGGLDDATKAALNDDSGDFVWEENDEISVYDATTSSIYRFSLSEDNIFTAELPERDPSEDDYNFTRAWFPASLVEDGAITDKITLPDTYQYADVKDASSIPLMASINKWVKQDGDDVDGELFFSHMAGIVKVTVNNVPAEATTLVFSSPDAVICGSFNLTTSGFFEARGEDAEPEDASGNITKAEDDYCDPQFVDEIKATPGRSAITVHLDLTEESSVTVYLPVATGSYNFTIDLNAGGMNLLSKSTTSRKTIARATFMQMSALNVETAQSPATNIRLRGDYNIGDTHYNFPTTTTGTIPFEPLYNGWYKADGFRVYGQQGTYTRRVRFKMCVLNSNGTSVSQHYSITAGGENRNHLLGTLLTVQKDNTGANANLFIPETPNETEFTVYFNPTELKAFMLKSSDPFRVPEAVASEADKTAHLYLNDEFCGTKSLQVVPEHPDWRAVYGIESGKEILFKSPDITAITNSVTLGAAAGGLHTAGGLIETGTAAFKFNEAVDVYVSADATTIFALPAGSPFAVPSKYEGSPDLALADFLTESAYGVYNLFGKYTGSFETSDQYAVAGNTFTLIKGWTFDKYTVEGVPASADVNDAASLTVSYYDDLNDVTRSRTMAATVVKVDGDKIWLFDATNGAGAIVRAANSDSGALSMEANPVYVATVPVTNTPRSGNIRIPVILLEFADASFSSGSKAALEAQFNTDANSIHQYFYDNSGGKLNITFDLLGPVTTSKTVAEAAAGSASSFGTTVYPGYAEALAEALTTLDATVDFKKYGYKDNFTFRNVMNLVTIHAGCNSQSGYGSITSRNCTIASGEYDGIALASYSVTPELESPGTVAYIGHATHELGHAFGLPDWYNTTNQSYKPLGRYSIMDFGDYNNNGRCPAGYNTVERIIAGFESQSSLVPITSSGPKTLHRMGADANNVHALYIPAEMGEVSDGTNLSEGFICEFRSSSLHWDSYLGGQNGQGMVVFHMDRADRTLPNGKTANSQWTNNADIPNTGLTTHPVFYVVHADSPSTRFAGSNSNASIPFPGTASVTRFNPVSWNDITTYVSLTDIPAQKTGDAMTINAHVRDFPMINDPKHGAYSRGDVLQLTLSQGAETCTDNVTSWFVNEAYQTGSSVSLSTSGTYTIVANIAGKQHLYLEITVK